MYRALITLIVYTLSFAKSVILGSFVYHSGVVEISVYTML